MISKNARIEFRTEPYIGRWRYVFYRIVPEDLPWWKRLFNFWHQVYSSYNCSGGQKWAFTINDYHEKIFPIKTIGQMEQFLLSENETIKRRTEWDNYMKEFKKQNGLDWPD